MSDLIQEGPAVANFELKGAGLPTPILEKQLELEGKGAYAEKTGSRRLSVVALGECDDDGILIPTAEELTSLRRVPGRIPFIAFTVAFVELCERFAYYGTTAVWVNFIQRKLPKGSVTGNDPHPNGRPGALNQGQRASTGIVTFNKFWAYFMPLIGGWVADSHWGKLKTLHVSIIVAIVGHIFMIISAIPQVIKHPDAAMGILSVGVVFFGAGVGGFKPNVSPMMVEQLKAQVMHVETLRSGEKVIVDPALTTQRIFMYFYLCINIGSIVGQISMVYAERYVGFWLSFLLPTIMFFICPFVLMYFKKRYVLRPPTGSVLGNSMRLIKYACHDKVSLNPVTSWRNLKSDNFWEDVKPSRLGPNKPSWMTFDDAWVAEVRRGVKACVVFIFYPIFWLAYNQIDGNLVSQASTMSLHGVPNDLINNLDPLGIVIMIPILDQLVYPALRKMKIRFSPLMRMCAGFFFACAAMIWAAVVQHYIYKTGPCGDHMNSCAKPSPLNVWIQSGAYVLTGLAEIFASITGLEYAYTKAPANMRSLVFGFYQFTTAFAAAVGEAWVGLADDPLLTWNYGSVAIIAFCGGILFWICFRGLDKQEEALNLLPESKYVGMKTTEGEEKIAGGDAVDVQNQKVKTDV